MSLPLCPTYPYPAHGPQHQDWRPGAPLHLLVALVILTLLDSWCAVSAVQVSTAPRTIYFDAADENGANLDFSFQLEAIRRRDNVATASSGAVDVFETELTVIVLDGSGANGDAVVTGVTDTRQYRGHWVYNNAGDAIEGTLIQNYEINVAELDKMRHKWEIVDDRFSPAISWNFTSFHLQQQHVVPQSWFERSFLLPDSTKNLLRQCTSTTSPISSTCCICHPASTSLSCVDGVLRAESSLADDVTGGYGCLSRITSGAASKRSCPFVCECQRKCEARQTDSFVTWTLFCCFVGFMILYYLINSCIIAAATRAAANANPEQP